MKIKPFILAFVATVLFSAISSATFTKDNLSTTEIKKNQKQDGDETQLKNQIYFFWDEVTCPDGTVMAAGVFGIMVNENNQIVSVYHDYWGETVACEDHQIVHWV